MFQEQGGLFENNIQLFEFRLELIINYNWFWKPGSSFVFLFFNFYTSSLLIFFFFAFGKNVYLSNI